MAVHPPTDPDYLEAMPLPTPCPQCRGTGRGEILKEVDTPHGAVWRFWSNCARCRGAGVIGLRPMGASEDGE